MVVKELLQFLYTVAAVVGIVSRRGCVHVVLFDFICMVLVFSACMLI